MTVFKALSGNFTKNAEDDYKGTVDASLTARAVKGSETDENYEFHTTVKPGNGKAAIIVNFNYSESWEERYIEMVLDPDDDTIGLDAVVRNEDGSEQSRTILASYSKALAYSTEYNLMVQSRKLSDGSYAVYGYIDDFMVVEAEDLADPFQKGMHGLESMGVIGDASDYSDLFQGPYGAKAFMDEVLKLVGLTTTNIGYLDLWDLVEKVIISAEGELNTTLTFTDLSDDERLLVKDLSAVAAALKASGGASSGSSFSLGDFSVKSETSTGTETDSNIAYLQTEIARLLERLRDIPFTVGQA